MDDEIRLGVLFPAGQAQWGGSPSSSCCCAQDLPGCTQVADVGRLFPVSGAREGDKVVVVVVKIRVSVTAPAEF
jgi:hypothetical protein